MIIFKTREGGASYKIEQSVSTFLPRLVLFFTDHLFQQTTAPPKINSNWFNKWCRLKAIEPLNIKPVKSATSRLNINFIHTIAGSRGVCLLLLLWASTHTLFILEKVVLVFSHYSLFETPTSPLWRGVHL